MTVGEHDHSAYFDRIKAVQPDVDNAENLFATSGYFASAPTAANESFRARYHVSMPIYLGPAEGLDFRLLRKFWESRSGDRSK